MNSMNTPFEPSEQRHEFYLARKVIWWSLVLVVSLLVSEILWPFGLGQLFYEGTIDIGWATLILPISFGLYVVFIELVFSPAPRADNYYIVAFTAFWMFMATKTAVLIWFMIIYGPS